MPDNLVDAVLGPVRRRRRPMAGSRMAPAIEPPMPTPERRAPQMAAKPEPEPEAPAELEATATDTAENDTVEAAIDERLEGLDGAARELALRRVVAAYAENNVEVLDLLDDVAVEAREQAQEDVNDAATIR